MFFLSYFLLLYIECIAHYFEKAVAKFDVQGAQHQTSRDEPIGVFREALRRRRRDGQGHAETSVAMEIHGGHLR